MATGPSFSSGGITWVFWTLTVLTVVLIVWQRMKGKDALPFAGGG